MKCTILPSVFVAAFLAGHPASGTDWPQWRGPLRNGVIPDAAKLLDTVPEAGLKELWESETIPANDEGGLSSPIAAGGKVFIALVWHRDVPAETRQIDELVMRQLGHQGTGPLGKDVVADLEKTRESIPPTLRGAKLDEFSQKWIDEHLTPKQKQLYSGFISNRFKKGRLAIPLEILDALDKHKDTVFASDAEMKQWLEAQGWPEEVRQQIVAGVPPTKRVAEDAVVCLDLATGQTLWKNTAPGAPRGRTASATPCVNDGKVFALGSTRLWCMDAATGKTVWESPLKARRGIGTSPLVVDGVIVINADALTAFDAATGRPLWQQDKAGGGSSSPVAWTGGGRTLVISNGRAALDAVDLKTGEVVWTAPGGGDSTPAIAGDILATQTRKPELGFVAYKLTSTGAAKLWNYPMDALRTQSSPIIHDGVVYLMDDNVQTCFDLQNGSQHWRETAQSTISSPVLADGKLFVMANNGNTLLVLKANPLAREELGKATVRAQWVPSPCLAGDRLVLRMKDKVKCWSLAQ